MARWTRKTACPRSLRPAAGEPRPGRPHSRGFTLLELFIAIALGAIVTSMALSALSGMNRALSRIEQRGQADNEARLLTEYLAEAVRNAGGGSLRPWMGIWVEDNYQGSGADRVIVAKLASVDDECVITALSGTTVTGEAAGGCCLGPGLVNRQVIIASSQADDYAHWVSRRVTAVDVALCRATLAPGLAMPLDESSSDAAVWVAGSLAPARVQAFWLDTATFELKLDEDVDEDGDIDTRVAADRVHDLQAALGYDVTPWNWHIADAEGTTDEWLYNAPGDTFGVADGQGLALARRPDLRMIRIAVGVGAPVSGYGDLARLQHLNGPIRLRAGWTFGSHATTVGLRNYAIMR